MLTARGQVVDKVLGLKLGADDYLTKPFDMLELHGAHRSAAAPRGGRPPATGATQYRVRRRHASISARPKSRAAASQLELSAREFLLLKYFIEHREATLTRDELLNEVWGYHSMPSTRTVDVHVAWLRQKIEPNSAAPAVRPDGARAGIQVRGVNSRLVHR